MRRQVISAFAQERNAGMFRARKFGGGEFFQTHSPSTCALYNISLSPFSTVICELEKWTPFAL